MIILDEFTELVLWDFTFEYLPGLYQLIFNK